MVQAFVMEDQGTLTFCRENLERRLYRTLKEQTEVMDVEVGYHIDHGDFLTRAETWAHELLHLVPNPTRKCLNTYWAVYCCRYNSWQKQHCDGHYANKAFAQLPTGRR